MALPPAPPDVTGKLTPPIPGTGGRLAGSGGCCCCVWRCRWDGGGTGGRGGCAPAAVIPARRASCASLMRAAATRSFSRASLSARAFSALSSSARAWRSRSIVRSASACSRALRASSSAGDRLGRGLSAGGASTPTVMSDVSTGGRLLPPAVEGWRAGLAAAEGGALPGLPVAMTRADSTRSPAEEGVAPPPAAAPPLGRGAPEGVPTAAEEEAEVEEPAVGDAALFWPSKNCPPPWRPRPCCWCCCWWWWKPPGPPGPN